MNYENIFLIHDNGSQFIKINYNDYGIIGVKTGIRSPNMNAYTERVVKSIRQEALKHFILFSGKQVKKIVEEYVNYFNIYRHHQGIDDIPDKALSLNSGRAVCNDGLFGLHHHYYRSSA